MPINWANNVSITLQLTLASSATTLILPTGKWGLLSGATPPLRGVIEEYDDTKNVVKREIVSITAISWDQLTISRAVEACPISDSASVQQQVSQVFATPTKTNISVAMTKGMLDDINQSIDNLTSDKLNASWGLRTGLTPNRVIATDGAGEEITVGWSSGQVLGFGAGGLPQAVSPTVDIGGLPSKTTPVGADKLIISDSQDSGVNKKVLLSNLISKYFGDWSDWNVTVSTNITLTRDMQYVSLTVTWSWIINTNWYLIYYTSSLVNDGIIRDIWWDGWNWLNPSWSYWTWWPAWSGWWLYKKSWGTWASWSWIGGGTPTLSTYWITLVAWNWWTGWWGAWGGWSWSNTTNRVQAITWSEAIIFKLQRWTLFWDAGGGGWSWNGIWWFYTWGGWGGWGNGWYVWLYGNTIPTWSGSLSVAWWSWWAWGWWQSTWGGWGGWGGWSWWVIDIPIWTTMTTNVLWWTWWLWWTTWTSNPWSNWTSWSNWVVVYH